MARLTIEGVLPYDGSYELDFTTLNHREWHQIHELAGILPPQLAYAIDARHMGLLVALAVVVLQRDGFPVDDRPLWESQSGKIILELAPEPVPLDETNDSSEPERDESPSAKPESSGTDSSDAGDPSANDQEPIGDRG